MSSESDFHLHFVSKGQSFDIDFQSSSESVLVGGSSYVLRGDEHKIAWLKAKLPELADMTVADLKERLQNLGVSDLTIEHSVHAVGMGQLDTAAEKVGATFEKVDSFLQRLVTEKDFRGQVLIVRDGKLFLNKGYGVANEDGGEITDQTIFHLGSITKQFTAAAIMLLQQRGLLNTRDLIKNHLPSRFAGNPRWQNITIHQLLNHTAGIRNHGADEEVREYDLEELIKKECENEDLEFEPGTAWLYSNGGYLLLGAIIEHVSGQSYGEFVKNTILDRLEMTSSGFGVGYSMEKAATGYCKDENETGLKPVKDQAIHLSKAHAAGALYSTGQDMLKWNAALYDDAFITPESKRLMFHSDRLLVHSRDKLPEERSTMSYGYGVGVCESRVMGPVMHHEGGTPGFATQIARFPKTKSCVIILSNVEGFDMQEINPSLERMIWLEQKEV